jgi:lariat debranching enzyme
MPEKYYDMHDFHEYYSGARTAPYLTIFIGGNHEASNYMWELYYGGWAAPNIYYMGAANVIKLGPLRIAGQSGIWKGYNYKKPHHERLPYNEDDIRSIYHVRELDTRKLLQLRSQVDIGLSHDWPRRMEWKGNHRQLFKFKPYFEQEAKDGTLGSVAATSVLERLRPRYWFSAHMHAKYSAIWEHKREETPLVAEPGNIPSTSTAKNAFEIDLDMDDDGPQTFAKNDAIAKPEKTVADQGTEQANDAKPHEIPEEIRNLLPASFARPNVEPPRSLPFPPAITNTTTQFLALDKCLPNRHFLQLLEIRAPEDVNLERPLVLEYDKEWLAITRLFAKDLQLGDPYAQVPVDKGDAHYRPLIEQEMDWVEENIVKKGKMRIPEDFEQTAPVYDASMGIRVAGQPQEYTNPHTRSFCEMLQIPNPFDATEEERARMMQRGPRPAAGGPARGGRGNRGQRGQRGRGRGRGGRGRGRGF